MNAEDKDRLPADAASAGANELLDVALALGLDDFQQSWCLKGATELATMMRPVVDACAKRAQRWAAGEFILFAMKAMLDSARRQAGAERPAGSPNPVMTLADALCDRLNVVSVVYPRNLGDRDAALDVAGQLAAAVERRMDRLEGGAS